MLNDLMDYPLWVINYEMNIKLLMKLVGLEIGARLC